MIRRRWRVKLAEGAERDLWRILAYTRDAFGANQEKTYKHLIYESLRKLGDGPYTAGSNPLDVADVRKLHIALGGSRGRHFLVYRATDEYQIDILRILHDASDLTRHLKGRDES